MRYYILIAKCVALYPMKALFGEAQMPITGLVWILENKSLQH